MNEEEFLVEFLFSVKMIAASLFAITLLLGVSFVVHWTGETPERRKPPGPPPSAIGGSPGPP